MSLQPALFAAPKPPDLRDRGIDLRCCDVMEMLESLDEPADLVVADPPWLYERATGATKPDDHYGCLPMPLIVEHVNAASRVGRRLALWTTMPLLGEWMRHAPEVAEHWGWPVTAATWVKSGEDDSGHFGQGYHFSGCAELVLIYTRPGAFTDRSVPVRNAWIEPPGEHSAKPVRWQAQWCRKFVPVGGRVVDLYAGRGTVAHAVLLAGDARTYIGAEIDRDRHAAACGLLAQVRT